MQQTTAKTWEFKRDGETEFVCSGRFPASEILCKGFPKWIKNRDTRGWDDAGRIGRFVFEHSDLSAIKIAGLLGISVDALVETPPQDGNTFTHPNGGELVVECREGWAKER